MESAFPLCRPSNITKCFQEVYFEAEEWDQPAAKRPIFVTATPHLSMSIAAALEDIEDAYIANMEALRDAVERLEAARNGMGSLFANETLADDFGGGNAEITAVCPQRWVASEGRVGGAAVRGGARVRSSKRRWSALWHWSRCKVRESRISRQ
jgi:hypothetical protein